MITVIASFSLSDNLTVEDVIGDDVIVDDVVLDDVDLSNDANDDNASNVVKKKLLGIIKDTPLYMDYLNGFEGFVGSLDDVQYVMYSENYPLPVLGNLAVKYNQSKNFMDFDMLIFRYNGSQYAIHTNSDLVDLNDVGAVPAYIVGDSIYVGHPKNGDDVRFEAFIVDVGIGIHVGGLYADNNLTNSSVTDNATSFLDDGVSVLEQNETGNITQNNSEVGNGPVLKTGVPVVALLVCLLVSIVGFRRKD